MNQQEKIEIMKNNGILRPEMVFKVSRWIGVPLWASTTFLQKETFGGQNIYSEHDNSTFMKGVVTHDNYRTYKAFRNHTGLLQGVGPMQLTAKEFQDKADKLGGCWLPLCNMIVGLEFIKDTRLNGEEKSKTWWEVAKRYNGSGERAEAYADDWVIKANIWIKRFEMRGRLK